MGQWEGHLYDAGIGRAQYGRICLLRFIGDFVEDKQLGAVRYESFQMKTGPNLPGREPDIVFVAKENVSRIKKNRLDGPADLVVEIVSPESQERDRIEKYGEYEQGGVREYWLIDPERQEALFYRRNAQGAYEPGPVGEDGLYESAVLPGLRLRVIGCGSGLCRRCVARWQSWSNV